MDPGGSGGDGGGVIRAYPRSPGRGQTIVEVRLTERADMGNNDIGALSEGGRIHRCPKEETMVKRTHELWSWLD